MPEKIKHKGAARKIRICAQPGNEGQTPLCPARSAQTSAAPIGGSSIYSVVFADKKGPEIFNAFGTDAMYPKEHDMHKMCSELFQAYARAKWLICGKDSFDFTSADIIVRMQLYNLLLEFKKLLPAEFKFNVDLDEETNKYFFTIFKYCENFDSKWHCIEIKPLVKMLKKDSPGLHDLFLSFLKAFCKKTGTNFWFEGYMYGTIETMPERFDDMESEYDIEDPEDAALIQSYKKSFECYKSGDARKYQLLIKKAKSYTPAEIIKRVKRFKKALPIATLIHEGCFLLNGNHIDDYRYMEDNDLNNSFFLELDCQLNIIWDITDDATREHEENLDCTANEGIQEPICSFRIDEHTNKLDFAELKIKSKWPGELSQYFSMAIDSIEKYVKANE